MLNRNIYKLEKLETLKKIPNVKLTQMEEE